MKKYDVSIIGAGPAGLTAALYSARNGLKVVVLAKEIGGTTNSIMDLENWPGYKGSGADLMKQMYEQVKAYGVEFIINDAKRIAKTKEGFLIKTEKEDLNTKTLIIATGTERKKLNLPNEVKFIGRGISYCVTCDGFFFKNMTVGIIGGSDCAAISALSLSNIAKEVHVFYRGKVLRCEIITMKRLKDKKNVFIHYDSVPEKIVGESKVEGLEVNEKGKKKTYKLDGIFIEIGSVPVTELFKDINIKIDEKNHIIVDEEMRTSVSGVFAAGDVTHHKLQQVVVAAGQGAIAAKSAYDYLNLSQ
jgi:thioredoxin-disulfide reductase